MHFKKEKIPFFDENIQLVVLFQSIAIISFKGHAIGTIIFCITPQFIALKLSANVFVWKGEYGKEGKIVCWFDQFFSGFFCLRIYILVKIVYANDNNH